MSKNYRDERFEFILMMDNNVICQRFFNVFGYNWNVLRSMELKDNGDYLVEFIQDHLKDKSLDHMDEYIYHYYDDSEYDTNGVNEKFYFYIKVDGKPVYQRIFPAYIYPTRVRYSVDIRDHIPYIIRIIQKTLALKNKDLTKYYLNKKL